MWEGEEVCRTGHRRKVIMKPSAILLALFLLVGACRSDGPPSSFEGIEPATTLQIEEIALLLEEDLRIRDVYRIRSADHSDGWYVAGRVYGAEAIDGAVAVWFVSEAAGAVDRLLAVDTMADACSFAPLEADGSVPGFADLGPSAEEARSEALTADDYGMEGRYNKLDMGRAPVVIRPEAASDRAAVRAVNASAFETPAEADLVDALREEAKPIVSLVAEENGVVVGHIMFSPVLLSGHPALKIMGLAPMAVLPERQRQGIGGDLVRAGLKRCRQLGVGAVVVLGHPAYYPRFGFAPAARFGLDCAYDVPEEAFMALELRPGYLRAASGTVAYHGAFGRA